MQALSSLKASGPDILAAKHPTQRESHAGGISRSG